MKNFDYKLGFLDLKRDRTWTMFSCTPSYFAQIQFISILAQVTCNQALFLEWFSIWINIKFRFQVSRIVAFFLLKYPLSVKKPWAIRTRNAFGFFRTSNNLYFACSRLNWIPWQRCSSLLQSEAWLFNLSFDATSNFESTRLYWFSIHHL